MDGCKARVGIGKLISCERRPAQQDSRLLGRAQAAGCQCLQPPNAAVPSPSHILIPAAPLQSWRPYGHRTRPPAHPRTHAQQCPAKHPRHSPRSTTMTLSPSSLRDTQECGALTNPKACRGGGRRVDGVEDGVVNEWRREPRQH